MNKDEFRPSQEEQNRCSSPSQGLLDDLVYLLNNCSFNKHIWIKKRRGDLNLLNQPVVLVNKEMI